MAVTRRGYIFTAFLLSVLSVLLIIVAISSDSWVVSSATATTQPTGESHLRYGLFRGELELIILITPTYNTLYMTCLADIGACAVSCKTDAQAREDEVRAMAEGLAVNPGCASFTTIEDEPPLSQPPVISFAFYVCLVLVLFLQLVFAVVAAGLAIINATKNPTEPVFGLPGCLWSNVVTAVLGTTVLLMFGIYWATSGLQTHLAFSYIAFGLYVPVPALGYSYWILIASIMCSFGNVALIELRRFLLERDPPPPTIKVENHSDGTIFLY